MNDFIEAHQRWLWILAVVAIVTAFWAGLHFGLRFLTRKLDDPRSIAHGALVRIGSVIRVFLVVAGLALVSYAFVDPTAHEGLNRNLLRVIWIAFVALLTIAAAAIVQSYFARRISTTARRDKQDVTTYKYLNYLSVFLIYVLGIVLAALAIPALKTLAASALAGAGVFALIAGVAAQEAFANIVGGLFIAFFKPFRIGDIIKIGDGTTGRVEDLTLRHTIINTFRNIRIVVPNAKINKENIVNYHLGEFKTCEFVEIGISYGSDIDLAMRIMREEAESHPTCLDNRSSAEKKEGAPKVDVQVICLDSSSVNLRAWVWSASYITGFRMRNDLFRSIKLRFDREGVEIPFPHRVLVHKGLPAGWRGSDPAMGDDEGLLQTAVS